MVGYACCEYLPIEGEHLFTVVLLPEEKGQFPVVVCRSPYVARYVTLSEEETVEEYHRAHQEWLKRGYAVVCQHCKGQGKSTGAFVPYIHEREDGLAFRQWIRQQPFYNGELYLMGASYTSSLHYATAPFEEDVRGAIFEVQDAERYRLWYRNGQMRRGHANWHFGLYKAKCGLNKHFDLRSFSQLPLSGLSQRVLEDCSEDFEQMLDAPSSTDTFWSSRFGGIDTKDAIRHAGIPILLTTGYNDFYVGGIFRMWRELDEETRRQCALLVSPYDHGDGYAAERGLPFPMGRRREQFGDTYCIDWFDHIRHGTPLPYQKGVITYYRTFEERWESDFDAIPTKTLTLTLGTGSRSFRYDPLQWTAFAGEGTFAEETVPVDAVLRVCTEPLERDVFVKGAMKATLAVSSDCPDTTFYVRISLKTDDYTYVLRHDIASLCFQRGAYAQGTEVTLDFSFDEHAFLLKKGTCLQVDIAGSDNNVYVGHTNRVGPYALQEGADVATNMVHLDRSYLYLPIE